MLCNRYRQMTMKYLDFATATSLHTFKIRQSAIQRPDVLHEPRRPKADMTSFLHVFREIMMLFYTQYRVRKC